MAERTEISWADATFNPWVGCTKVSAACDHCYAESWAKRSGHPELWTGERRRTSSSNWQQPIKWNRAAAAAGVRRRVFCASLADVFDNQVPAEWRGDLWRLIEATPHLDWLLLTKRPQNIAKMLPPFIGVNSAFFYRPWPWPNVWLGTTVENQVEADRRIPQLLAAPAAVRFLSCEPLLGPVNLTRWMRIAWQCSCCRAYFAGSHKPTCPECGALGGWSGSHAFNGRQNKRSDVGSGIDWCIAGGESGGKARAMEAAWARSLRDQCAAANVAFHFKQWGGLRPKSNGCELDGVEHKAFPAALAA